MPKKSEVQVSNELQNTYTNEWDYELRSVIRSKIMINNVNSN